MPRRVEFVAKTKVEIAGIVGKPDIHTLQDLGEDIFIEAAALELALLWRPSAGPIILTEREAEP